jgi:hypothetical protein
VTKKVVGVFVRFVRRFSDVRLGGTSR